MNNLYYDMFLCPSGKKRIRKLEVKLRKVSLEKSEMEEENKNLRTENESLKRKLRRIKEAAMNNQEIRIRTVSLGE